MKNVHVKSLCALALLSFSLPGVCSTAESEPAHIAKETPATPPKNAAEQQTKSLENSPQTLEKLRLLLKKGIPEHMTIRVSGGGTTTPTVQTAAMGGEAQQAETPNTEAPHSTTAHTTQPAHIAVPGTRKNTKEAGEQHGEWSYSGNTGPAHWHTLGPENALCNKGQMQSPVHIQTQEAIALPLEPIEWHYGKLAGNLTNNGHTLQVDLSAASTTPANATPENTQQPSATNSISVRGQRYELVQFHFHHPAEERINGQSFPMVIHMVHRSAAGELAVVALLVEVGEANPIVNHLWSRLPFLPGQTSQLASNLFSLTDLLPNDKSYFVFTGSLTTPPCTENVLWLVMQQPITLSTAQVATFGQVYPLNSRPLQPVNNRLIQASQPVNAVAASF